MKRAWGIPSDSRRSGRHWRGPGLNTLRPPFDDVRVRRAVHLWVDRYSAIESLGQGFGVPQCLMNDTAWCNEDYLTWPGYNRETKEADRAEAKRLLAEAGYPEGLKFTITGPRNRSVGLEWWSGALAGSGFEVEFEFLEVAASDDRRARSEYTASYGGGGSIDPESGLRVLSTKDVSPQAGPVHNDPKVAEFFKRMGAESEFEARREISGSSSATCSWSRCTWCGASLGWTSSSTGTT